MFLDTNFLIELSRELQERRVGPARRFLGRHREAPVAVSTIALGELAAGMVDDEEARRFVSRFRVVSLKPEIALAAAAIDRELMAEGFRLGENDNWLAGFALYYGTPLVTNDRDFERVTGLRTLGY